MLHPGKDLSISWSFYSLHYIICLKASLSSPPHRHKPESARKFFTSTARWSHQNHLVQIGFACCYPHGLLLISYAQLCGLTFLCVVSSLGLHHKQRVWMLRCTWCTKHQTPSRKCIISLSRNIHMLLLFMWVEGKTCLFFMHDALFFGKKRASQIKNKKKPTKKKKTPVCLCYPSLGAALVKLGPSDFQFPLFEFVSLVNHQSFFWVFLHSYHFCRQQYEMWWKRNYVQCLNKKH